MQKGKRTGEKFLPSGNGPRARGACSTTDVAQSNDSDWRREAWSSIKNENVRSSVGRQLGRNRKLRARDIPADTWAILLSADYRDTPNASQSTHGLFRYAGHGRRPGSQDEGRGFDMWDSGQEIVSRDRRETGKPQALFLSVWEV